MFFVFPLLSKPFDGDFNRTLIFIPLFCLRRVSSFWASVGFLISPAGRQQPNHFVKKIVIVARNTASTLHYRLFNRNTILKIVFSMWRNSSKHHWQYIFPQLPPGVPILLELRMED